MHGEIMGWRWAGHGEHEAEDEALDEVVFAFPTTNPQCTNIFEIMGHGRLIEVETRETMSAVCGRV